LIENKQYGIKCKRVERWKGGKVERWKGGKVEQWNSGIIVIEFPKPETWNLEPLAIIS